MSFLQLSIKSRLAGLSMEMFPHSDRRSVDFGTDQWLGGWVTVVKGQRSQGESRVRADTKPYCSFMEFVRECGRMKESLSFIFVSYIFAPFLLSEDVMRGMNVSVSNGSKGV